jgi:quinone-modifying oxidoreductase subunit QmoC
MSVRVDPTFKKELTKFGKGDWNECFHCGNCTAICPLSENDFLFPRSGLRDIQMGLKNDLSANVNPWLCYYCGECSETCPRNANPGELMMALRRYLISIYDWTGLSGIMFRSKTAHVSVMLFLFFTIIAAFSIFAKIPVLADPMNVQLNTFAPADLIAFLDHIMLFTLSFFLITNIINMYLKIIRRDKSLKIPVWLYVKELYALIWHFVTQLRFSKCNRKKSYWFWHWFLMSSYTIMFILIIIFLDWFQTDEIHSILHPQRWLGYYVTIGIIGSTVYYFIGRLKKKEEIFKYSHHSDWIFIFLLFMIALTGIFIHIFRLNAMALPTYYAYVAHLAFEVPMVVTFVAFSKWSHIAYRPFAMYFTNLKKAALALKSNR